MDRVVSLTDVAISYGSGQGASPVTEGLDLEVERGEFVVICGVSGVGKSTLLRVVCGLMPPSAGRVDVAAEEGADRRPFGFVFQEPRLFPWRRVAANVAFGLEGLEIAEGEQKRRVDESLRLVGLSAYHDRYPRQLSGGQRQRVGIARALAVRPSLLLMDEPFGSLDAVTRRSLQQELLQIWQTTRTSVLFVTHDVEEAVFLADRIILLAGSPAGVREEYLVGPQRPRSIDDSAVQAIVRRLRDDLQSYQDSPVL